MQCAARARWADRRAPRATSNAVLLHTPTKAALLVGCVAHLDTQTHVPASSTTPHVPTSPHPHPTRQVLLVTGGATGARALSGVVRNARREQRQLCADVATTRRGGKPSAKVAVDGLFFRRLVTILKM